MNEAAWLVHDDAATIAEVDSTTKFDMGLPMGSFELSDQVGNDVGLHVLEYMHEVLGEPYAPCPLLEEKVENERPRAEDRAGFYDYEDGGRRHPDGCRPRRGRAPPRRRDGKRGRETRRERRRSRCRH